MCRKCVRPTTSSVGFMYKDGLVESAHLENSAGLAITVTFCSKRGKSSMSRLTDYNHMETVFTFSRSFTGKLSQYNNCCNDQDPFCRRSFRNIFM